MQNSVACSDRSGSWQSGMRSAPWVWGLILAVCLTGGMLLADFCIVDDWLVARWLVRGDAWQLSSIWPALLETEIGSLGAAGRFRPAFFSHLALETWLFGDRPVLYQALLVAYFGIFLGAAGRIAARCVGLLPALALIAGVAGLGFWNDLWTRSLGPTEQLAILGMSLVLVALGTIVPRLVSGQRVPGWALPVASLGTAIASGSKENFIFLLAVLGPVTFAMALMRQLRPIATLLALPPLVVPALVAYALLTIAGNSHDFYGADNSIAHRLGEMLAWPQLLAQPFLVPFALAAPVVAVLLARFAEHRSPLPGPERRRAIVAFLGCTCVLALYLLWELFFYNGRLPSGTRYDFPLLLLPPAIALGFAAFIRHALLPGGGTRWRGVQVAFLALTALYLYRSDCAFSLPKAVDVAIARTTAFRHDFSVLRESASAHPDWPIVLEPNRPWDYELVYAFRVWQRFFQVPNPVLVRVEVAPEDVHGAFEQWLTDQMRGWGTGGLPGRFAPLPDLAALNELEEHCFGIGYTRPIVSPCVPLPFRPDRYIPRT